MHKLQIDNREYTSWKWNGTDTEGACIDKNPAIHHYLHDDVIDEKGDIIIPSPYRENKTIPAILVLENCKTYGRKNGRLLYKCIPDSRHLPHFMIPYDNKCIQFRKKPMNKFILFCFKEWTDKHPLGMITHVLGDVDQFDTFCDYQMYCKSLMHSITEFNKTAAASEASISAPSSNTMDNILSKYKHIQDRREHNVFSIDPENCTDIDDAMGIFTTKTHYIISIYISNVTLWMEVFKLWNVFSERISTIYFPNKRVHMLPTLLSEKWASLKEGVERFAFCMDIHIHHDNFALDSLRVESIDFVNVIVNLERNYVYEERDLLVNSDYKKIMEITRTLCVSSSNNVSSINNVNDSHELVEYYMIMMNHECGKVLASNKTGIFRMTEKSQAETLSYAPPLSYAPLSLKFETASYCTYENNKGHSTISDTYTHITSPIRRVVDLINITTIQKQLGLITCSCDCERFIDKWYSRLDIINERMRSIRRIQNDCLLLHLCLSGKINMDDEIECYVWRDNNKDYINVYVPSIKMNTQIHAKTYVEKEYKDYSLQSCKVFVINDETSLKKKIRIMLV
jgi:exoribonuclease R